MNEINESVYKAREGCTAKKFFLSLDKLVHIPGRLIPNVNTFVSTKDTSPINVYMTCI